MSQHDTADQSRSRNLLEHTIRNNMPLPTAGLRLPRLPERWDRLLGLLETMRAWISESDQLGRMTYASPQVWDVIGFTPEECTSNDCIEFHPDDLDRVVATGRSVRRTGRPAKNRTRIRHKLGHWVWVESTVLGWTDDNAGFHTLAYCRDISDIKIAEAAQHESEARYRVVAQMSCDLITEMDRDGRYTYVGPSCEEILGYTGEEILALEPWSTLHPDDRDRVRAQFEKQFVEPSESRLRNREMRVIEARIRHKDGQWLWFETQGVPYTRADGKTRFLAVGRDVSERIRAEQAHRDFEQSMQRSQKLESLGVLASGIAHDFNNLLTPILGAAGLGAMELPNDSPIRERLRTIQHAAKRAAALTNQMLSYAGQKPLRVERFDLTSLVESMRELATSSVAGKTTIDLKLKPELPFVEGESAQLSQVIMNLISNAAEALTEGSGKLTIETGVVTLPERPADVLFGESMRRGEHVYFEVSDTGCGMDKETLDRVFDPFFTTKFTGRGLGLAAVAGIVRGHRGGIKVTSSPGNGTCFRVMFPAIRRPAVHRSSNSAPTQPLQLRGTALVVDDDEGVRELSEEVLRRAGMNVLTAADGNEGVKLFERHADEICVVLLDRTMPSLSGADTFQAIRAIRDQAKIVLVSGYSEERVTAELAGQGLSGFLKKPFLPESLLSKVREVLKLNR